MATKTKTAKTTAKPLDWSLKPRGVVSGTAQAAVGLLALAGAGELAQVNPMWAAMGAGVGALGHVTVAATQNAGPGALLYRLGCWAGAGGWLAWTWTSAGEVWTTDSLAAMAVGAVGAGVTAPLARIRKPAGGKTSAGAAGAAVVLRSSLAVQWEARFLRVCRIAVQVTAVKRWDNGAGYDVHAVLPPGPHTRKQVASAGEALAADARLPEGCGVEAKPGGHRGEFVLAVSTVNRLGTQVLPYPADYTPRSILDPVPLGEYRDASVAGVGLREASVLVTGRKGGGKTNQLDVLTLGIGRCRDALNWHIDLNGGGMSQFWLNPWLEGEIDRPPIDWCASTPQEALLMVKVAKAIAMDRKTSYRTFKANSNSKLLPISDRLPEIVISIDEGAEVLSPANRDPITRQVRDGLEEIQRIGRNEAVNVIVSSLRPTSDMIAPAILKQSAIKMALFGLDEADLGHLYSWPQGISMDDLPTMGCAFLGIDKDIRPMKAWFLEPAQIRDAALAIARIRPDLDAASAEVANAEFVINTGNKVKAMTGIYADRHTRMRAAFTGQAPAGPATTAEPDPDELGPLGPAQPAAPASAGASAPANLRVINGGASSWPDPIPARQATPAVATVTASAWPDPLPARTGTATATVTAAPTVTAAAPVAELEPAGAVPEDLARALAVFDDAGDDRMHSEALSEALGLESPGALADLLRPYGVQPRPPFVRDGLKRRGYWRDDIAAAVRTAQAEPASNS